FFFQAEDGIRDFHVTGVQTCALPIFNRVYDEGKSVGFVVDYIGVGNHLKDALDFYDAKEASDDIGEGLWDIDRIVAELQDVSSRSEERRVGKECRAQRWGEQ